MIYRQGPELRHVRMNEAHPAAVTPSWYGDSVGHYEGDVLVIDTVGIKSGPFAMVDMYGTPHSPALHVVERYRLVDYDDAKDAMERNKENSYIAATSAAGIVEFNPNYRGKLLQLHFTVEEKASSRCDRDYHLSAQRRPLSEVGICAENIHWYPAGTPRCRRRISRISERRKWTRA
jgi:tRNA A37 threonylcarbamoyladenosine biosynthesis protein TsaE